MECKKYIYSFIFLSLQVLSAQIEVSFMRFYADELAYKSDIRLLATERFNNTHIQVFYSESKLPILKEWVGPDGEIQKREVLEHTTQKKLSKKFFLSTDQEPDSLIQYGEDEPWSKEFRRSLNNKNNRGYYFGQESKFILNESSQIEFIKFSNIQGEVYGQIKFIYDHLGLLKGEVWMAMPSLKAIRRFAYSVDMLSGRKEIWEYNSKGQEISHVALTRPPAGELYKTLPPRYGNQLDEISAILEDIRSKDLAIPFDIFIPKTDFDLMILTNGDSLMIQLLDLGAQKIIFKISGKPEVLTMPKFRVKSVDSKYGERIYP